jgi:hypothetical protein
VSNLDSVRPIVHHQYLNNHKPKGESCIKVIVAIFAVTFISLIAISILKVPDKNGIT